MSISKPQDRQEFKQHILTKLGAPVVEVNVSDEQLDVAIDDAFQYFNERNHFNGVERMYLTADTSNPTFRNNFTSFHTDEVNQDPTDLDSYNNPNYTVRVRRQNNFILLPDDVVGVTKILRPRRGIGGIGGIGGGMPGFGYPGLIAGINGQGCDNTGFGLAQYYVMQQYLALIEFTLYPAKMYNWNSRTHRLFIDGDLNDLGGMLCMEVMVKPNPDIFPDLWNDMFLKSMATAMVQLQWGRNLTKYTGVQLPGGISLNGDRILNDAQEQLSEIKSRFSMDFMDPVLDEVG